MLEKQEVAKKKSWDAPALTVYGSLAEITGQDKQYGGDDGYTFMGQPIQNAS